MHAKTPLPDHTFVLSLIRPPLPPLSAQYAGYTETATICHYYCTRLTYLLLSTGRWFQKMLTERLDNDVETVPAAYS